jgi:AAA15 family ATPase/GTPase
MVQDKAVNTKGAQLIFTTHDAMLLDLNFFRRDQIWFAEKNDETCATELYSLASFSPRKGENVRKESFCLARIIFLFFVIVIG